MQQILSYLPSAKDYWKDIPKDVGKKMLIGFIGSSAIRTLISRDIVSGIFVGVLAATAAAIHALITPFFSKISHNQRLSWEQEMCRSSISVILAGTIGSIFGEMSVLTNLLGLGVLYGLYNHLDKTRRDLAKASWFIILN